MTTGAARVRISRVRMKNGGADVTVVTPPSVAGHTIDRMRDWHGAVMAENRAPDAFCAIAIWLDQETPGYPVTLVGYATQVDSILTAQLPDLLAAYVRQRITVQQAEVGTIEALGYEIEPDDPAA